VMDDRGRTRSRSWTIFAEQQILLFRRIFRTGWSGSPHIPHIGGRISS